MESLKIITIKGFKSIKKCELKLNNLNILIGSNGAGKSNFISSFVLLQDILDKELQIYTSQNGINSLFYMGPKETNMIQMDFDFGHNAYGFALAPTNNSQLYFIEEYYSYNGTKSIIKSSRGSMESHWDLGVDNLMDHYVIPVLQKREWKVYHFHDTSKTAKIKQECDVQNNLFLMSDAGNLAAFLLRLKNDFPQNYQMILNTVKLVAPFVSDFILKPSGTSKDRIAFKWKQKGCEDVFNSSQLSDGTLRFTCLTTLLLQPTILQPSTIIIDEPELGLHPYAVVLLSDMIKKTQKKVQIIISTQSVDLINEFEAEDIIIVETGDEGTTFNRLNSEDLQSWLDDYSIGELWKKNIIGGRP